jgi:hypothetical protein
MTEFRYSNVSKVILVLTKKNSKLKERSNAQFGN